MMTKRSNHMPMVTRTQMRKIHTGLVRAHLNQKSWGLTTLQKIMIQYAHQ